MPSQITANTAPERALRPPRPDSRLRHRR